MIKTTINILIISLFMLSCAKESSDSPQKTIIIKNNVCEFFAADNYLEAEVCSCPDDYEQVENGYFCQLIGTNTEQLCSFLGAENNGEAEKCDCPINYLQTENGYSCDQLPRCLANLDEARNSGDFGECICNDGFISIETSSGFECTVDSSQGCNSPFATNNGSPNQCVCIDGYIKDLSNGGFSCKTASNICSSAYASNSGINEPCSCIQGYTQENTYSCKKIPICTSENASTNSDGTCFCDEGFEQFGDGYDCRPRLCEAKNNLEAENSGRIGQCVCNQGYLASSDGYDCEAVPTCISSQASNRYAQAQCICTNEFNPVQASDGFNFDCEQSFCLDSNADNFNEAGSCICSGNFQSTSIDGFSSCFNSETTCLDENASNSLGSLPCSCNDGYILTEDENGDLGKVCSQSLTFKGLDSLGNLSSVESTQGQFDTVLISRESSAISNPLKIGLSNESCLFTKSQLNFNFISYSQEKINDDFALNLIMNETEASLKRVNPIEESGSFTNTTYQDVLNSFAFVTCENNFLRYSSGNGESIEVSLSLDNKYAIMKYIKSENTYSFFGVEADFSNIEEDLPLFEASNDLVLIVPSDFEGSGVIDYRSSGLNPGTYVGVNYGYDESSNQSSSRAVFSTFNGAPSNDNGDHYRWLFTDFSIGNIGTILGPYKQDILIDKTDENCTETQEEAPYDCEYVFNKVSMFPKTNVGGTSTQASVQNQGNFLSFYDNQNSSLINLMNLMPQNRDNYVEKFIYQILFIESLESLEPEDI